MPALALLAILALPLSEIAAFVVIGGEIGVLATLVWVVLAIVLGVALLRDQPLRAVTEVRAAMARREAPTRALFDTLCRTVAAILLILPGFVSDAVALLLLVPAVRGLVYRRFGGRADVRVVMTGGPRDRPTGPAAPMRVIEGEFTHVDDTPPPGESAWRTPPTRPGS